MKAQASGEWCIYGANMINCKLAVWPFENAVSLQQVAKAMAGLRDFETDLGQLPGHHPLIKDGMSDEGVSEHFKVPLSACNLYLRGN